MTSKRKVLLCTQTQASSNKVASFRIRATFTVEPNAYPHTDRRGFEAFAAKMTIHAPPTKQPIQTALGGGIRRWLGPSLLQFYMQWESP